MRRLLGISVLVILATMVAAAAVAQLPPGGTFVDDNGNEHEPNIEAIAAAGITLGCNPPLNNRYCPGDPVTRAQMAAFLLRGIGEAANLPTYQGYFSDVPVGQWYTGNAERLYQLAITTGCAANPLRYCPSDTVTRAQMAAFILRAIGEDQNLPAYQGYFSDVPAGLWYTGYVERLFQLGITTGCGPGKYCPSNPVKRDQMASFLARALGLAPIIPLPPTTTSSLPEVGTFDNPYPIGTPAPYWDSLFDTDPNWIVEIEWVDPDGYSLMFQECLRKLGPFPSVPSVCDAAISPPATGATYLMVNISLTRVGPGSGFLNWHSQALTAPSGAAYQGVAGTCSYPGTYIPNQLSNLTVFQGVTVNGNFCWHVALLDLGSLRFSNYSIGYGAAPPFFGPL